MKTNKIKVSRTVEVPGSKDEERSTTVSFRDAEDANEALVLCGGSIEKFMSYFNSGRWSEYRTKVSNALANKTPQQRAFDKMVSAMKVLQPGLTDGQYRQLVLGLPNMAAAASTSVEVIPQEIDETYFDKNPEAASAETAELAAK